MVSASPRMDYEYVPEIVRAPPPPLQQCVAEIISSHAISGIRGHIIPFEKKSLKGEKIHLKELREIINEINGITRQ